MSFRNAFDSFISHPAIYRVQTRLLGRKKLDEQMRAAIGDLLVSRPSGVIADVGGGTAQTRNLWPDTWTYISIDPDERMTELEDAFQIDRRIGGADELPLTDQSVDVVMLQNMSHHLDDGVWIMAINEARRVLKPSGELLFMDAYYSKKRILSRIFWKLDAGHFPRLPEQLESDIASNFNITSLRRFTLVHHVLLITASPR